MELKSKKLSVKVSDGKKRIFNSLLVGSIMTTCISCSMLNNEIRIEKLENDISLCKNNIRVLESNNDLYLNNGYGVKVHMLDKKRNNVNLLIETNNNSEILHAHLNSKFKINKTDLEICDINNDKITIGSSKKISLQSKNHTNDEILFTGLVGLLIISMMIGSAKSIRN